MRRLEDRAVRGVGMMEEGEGSDLLGRVLLCAVGLWASDWVLERLARICGAFRVFFSGRLAEGGRREAPPPPWLLQVH